MVVRELNVIKLTKNRKCCRCQAVDDTREVMLITTDGIIIQIKCDDISNLGRITSGVKLINLDDGVKVATIAKVRKNL